MAFFLKSYADFPSIDRVYYFQMVTDAECGKKRRGNFRCSLSEFGLLGTKDDAEYRNAVAANDKTFVIPAPPRQPSEPSNSFYSEKDNRRFSFCLLRDRKPRWLTKASRISRNSSDAADYCAP